MNKNSFPKDFFELGSPHESNINKAQIKIPQKERPKIINPSNTIKIIPQKIEEIKEIKEETIEESESIDYSQLKKVNLKIILPDNSNDEMEPSTSGSKHSQNTPSNSPLIYIEKNKKKEGENKIISLNKNDKSVVKNEELFKITPHFLNDNNNSTESLNAKNILKRPITPNIDNAQKMCIPLTCDNKNLENHKFNFNFETKGNGCIMPKFINKDDGKKNKKISNSFRIGNKASTKKKNVNKQNYKNSKVYTRRENHTEKKNQSPLNSSLVSIKNNEQNKIPIKALKQSGRDSQNKILENEGSSKNIRGNRRCPNIDNKKKLKGSRPKSVKNMSPKKRNINCNAEEKKILQKKQYYNSVNKNIILPYLTENTIKEAKLQIQKEFSNLCKILPDNYEEDAEIKNEINSILQTISRLKDYIQHYQSPYRPNRNFHDKNYNK